MNNTKRHADIRHTQKREKFHKVGKNGETMQKEEIKHCIKRHRTKKAL